MGGHDHLVLGPESYDSCGAARNAPTRAFTCTPIVCFLVTLVVLGASCSKEPRANGSPTGANATLAAALRAHADGHLDEASGLYHRVLILEPQNKFAYYNLGLIAQTRGLVQDAEEAYEQTLAIDPRFEPALFNLAIVRTGLGKIRSAMDLYRQAITVDPNDARAHLNLGFLLLQSGRRVPGGHEFTVAVDLDPSLASRIPADVPLG